MFQVTSPPQQSISEMETAELSTSVTSVSERDDTCSEKDRDSMWDKDRSESRASSSTSAATLTNVSGSNNLTIRFDLSENDIKTVFAVYIDYPILYQSSLCE